MTARIMASVPAQAKRGEAIEIKTLISHPMESGYRVGPNGAMIPRDIIRLFTCTYNGEEVFRAELSPAIAANPFLSFFTTAVASGTLDVPLDRRQRLRGHPDRRDHGRVSLSVRALAWPAGASSLSVVMAAHGGRPAGVGTAFRLRFHEPRDPRDAG